MSEFLSMPKQWHDSLDAKLPPLRLYDYMTGTKNERIKKVLLARIKNGPVKTDEFCKSEGIKYNDLYKTMHNMAETHNLYEDFGEIGML